MEFNNNLFIGVFGVIMLYTLNLFVGIVENPTLAALTSFLLAYPWKIGKHMYSVFGGGINDIGSVISLISFYQKSNSHGVISVFSVGYQRGKLGAVAVFALGYQESWEKQSASETFTNAKIFDTVCLFGIIAQRAQYGESFLFVGISVQNASRAYTYSGIQLFAQAQEFVTPFAIFIFRKVTPRVKTETSTVKSVFSPYDELV